MARIRPLVAFITALSLTAPWSGLAAGDDRAPLARDAFVVEVMAANPDLEAAQAALDASRGRSRAAGAWQDPVLRVETTPLAFASGGMAPGVSVGLGQALPVGGERSARLAAAEAGVLGRAAEVDRVRLDLALGAALGWDAWYGVHASLGTLERHVAILEQLMGVATSAYAAGRAGADAPLEVSLMQARIEQQRAWLQAERDSIGAELDRLLHRADGPPLPAPAPLASEAFLDPPRAAEESHPTVRAADAASDAARAELEMARAAKWPMVGVMVSYSSMWDAPEHRLMAGVELGLPVWRGARVAQVDAAEAMVTAAERERDGRLDALRAERAAAEARVEAAQQDVSIQAERVLPLARERLAVLQAAVGAGQVGLDEVLRAERELLDAELALDVGRVRLLDAMAALDHARGRLPPMDPQEDSP